MKKDYDKNEFGGGNRTSLYVPMSELEQEALSRLVEAGDLRVHIVEWGVVSNPRIVFGDARLTLSFRMDFTKPELPQDVFYFDLELRTGAGLVLFRDRKSTEYGGKPIGVAAGMFIDMEWAIQIQAMDPKLVKALTGARGLTSRLQDRDTGELTETGTMHLNTEQKGRIHMLRTGEQYVRENDVAKAVKAKAKTDWQGPR
jgi:hypothetical protein